MLKEVIFRCFHTNPSENILLRIQFLNSIKEILNYALTQFKQYSLTIMNVKMVKWLLNLDLQI